MEYLKLCDYIFKIDKPILFKRILKRDGINNSAIDWSPRILSEIFKEQKFEFRIGKKIMSNLQYENECDYIEASFNEFLEWYESKNLNDNNPFIKYKKDDYWAYCDYKYMVEIFNGNLKNCINWSQFGFDQRNAKDSTFWMGTDSAYTPCHYDTYGYNLVSQIYGRKRWIIFPKSDTECLRYTCRRILYYSKILLSPIRIPFEESTVYSEINIKSPDLEKFPNFKKSHPHVVELEAGDVLYVPHHYWHYVECLDLSIAVNTWVELEDDCQQRLKEILTKTFLQNIMELNFRPFETWLNETENFTTHDENIITIQNCLDEIKSKKTNTSSSENQTEEGKKSVESHENFSCYINQISFDDYFKNYTKLIQKMGLNDENKENKEKKSKFDLTLSLSKSVTNPKVIDLISSLLLSENV